MGMLGADKDAGTPGDMSDADEAYFERLINTDLFQAPIDVHYPGDSAEKYPVDQLGSPSEFRDPGNLVIDPGESEEHDSEETERTETPTDELVEELTRYVSRAWPSEYADTVHDGDDAGGPGRDFIERRGLPDGRDSVSWDDTTEPVQPVQPVQQPPIQPPGPDMHFPRQVQGDAESPDVAAIEGHANLRYESTVRRDNAIMPIAGKLPPEMDKAARKVAEDIALRVFENVFGSAQAACAEVAHARKSGTLSDRPYLQNAERFLVQHAKNLGIEKEVAAMQAAGIPTPSGTTTTPSEGPLDPFTFPATAPKPEFHPPGQTTSPGDPAEVEQDETVFPDGTRPSPFTPPGDKTGTPATTDPTEKKIDESTFPPSNVSQDPHTNYASSLDTEVVPSDQNPEAERHQASLQKAARVPWESKNTSFDSLDDGHTSLVEAHAQAVDLYHRRFAKNAQAADLDAECASFKEVRAAMGTMAACMGHVDAHRQYAKEVFAFSFGQIRQSLGRASRNFIDNQQPPDLAAYRTLRATKADLLGPASMKYFASISGKGVVTSACTADDDGDSEDPSDRDTETAGAIPDKVEDKEDMKKDDVKAAIGISLRLQNAGLIEPTIDAFIDSVLAMAEASPADRLVQMAALVSGDKIVPAASPTTIGLAAAESNLVRSPTSDTTGGNGVQHAANVNLGLFAKRSQAPISIGGF